MAVLVTGGAGYIGSHAVLRLLERGERVVVLDNLSTGVRRLVSQDALFIEGDIGDENLLKKLLMREQIESVIHFAGSTVVPESVAQPLVYYHNNTVKSATLIRECLHAGIRAFVFSSTAAVYGEGEGSPISESRVPAPLSPYGRSKLAIEWILKDAGTAHQFPYTCLRYFNVAGADPLGRSGQSTPNATHLIKIAAEAATGKRPRVEIFGTDYPTPDGTCVRDYIHVSDLIEAHILAIESLRGGATSRIFNCGYGHGYSVREVLGAFNTMLKRPIVTANAERRPGDAAQVVAEVTAIREALGWQPRFDNLKLIVESALKWEQGRN